MLGAFSRLIFLVILLVGHDARSQSIGEIAKADFIEQAAEASALKPERQRQLKEMRSPKSVRSASVFKHGLTLSSASQISIHPLNGPTLKLTKRSEVRRSASDLTWIGVAEGGGDALIVFKDKSIFGVIDYGDRKFEIRSLEPGLYALIEVDISKLPPEHPQEHPSGVVDPKPPKSDRARLPQEPQTQAALAVPTIDVLVMYTPLAASNLGSIPAAAQLAADRMNQSFSNSGVNLAVRIVATAPVNQDFMSSSAALAALELPSQHAFLARKLRDQYLADVVVMFATFSDACGLARGQPAASPQWAYAVVDGSCLGNHVFAHEIGHLIGAGHNVENNSTPGTNHGYHVTWAATYTFNPQNNNHTECWHTIMSYQSAAYAPANTCGPYDQRINYWSNPNVLYTDKAPDALNGFGNIAESGPSKTLPTGSSSCCNNAAVLNSNGAYVSNFSATPINPIVLSIQTIVGTLLME